MKKDIEIFTSDLDKVIDSYVAIGKTTYKVALKKLYPLIGRFEAQRKLQDKKFYKRLQRDIVEGCIMPPITIAFLNSEKVNLSEVSKFEDFVNENIDSGYILDGMQRLNTLNSASAEDLFDGNRVAYVNVIVANSQDKLLYRMITLNNGQRPMTPRHQIEILTAEMFNFGMLKNILVQTEKDRAEKVIKGSFSLGDISRGYLAFLTNNVNNENNKIVNEKMDEILVSRVLDTREISNNLKFEEILLLIDNLCIDGYSKDWFKVNNNLIGFCVGIKDSHEYLVDIDPHNFSETLKLFEQGFDAINASKVNVGKYRRELSCEFIKKYSDISLYESDEIIEYFVEFTS